MAEALDPLGKLAISVLAAVIDIGDFAAAAGVEIALEDIGGEIVVAGNGRFRRRPHVRRRIIHRCVSSSATGFAHPLPTTKPLCRRENSAAMAKPAGAVFAAKLRYDKACQIPAGAP